MSPHLVLLWQRNGFCSTSTFTSAAGISAAAAQPSAAPSRAARSSAAIAAPTARAPRLPPHRRRATIPHPSPTSLAARPPAAAAAAARAEQSRAGQGRAQPAARPRSPAQQTWQPPSQLADPGLRRSGPGGATSDWLASERAQKKQPPIGTRPCPSFSMPNRQQSSVGGALSVGVGGPLRSGKRTLARGGAPRSAHTIEPAPAGRRLGGALTEGAFRLAAEGHLLWALCA